MYVCDGAGSAIRTLNERTGQVSTLVGHDPWQHGRTDGARHDARLQDPQAVALDPDAPLLWIADTGNDALRTLRLGGGELATWSLPQRLHGSLRPAEPLRQIPAERPEQQASYQTWHETRPTPSADGE